MFHYTIMGNKGVVDNITELYTTLIDTSDVFKDTVVDAPLDLLAYSENVILKETSVKVSLKPEINAVEEVTPKTDDKDNETNVEENQ